MLISGATNWIPSERTDRAMVHRPKRLFEYRRRVRFIWLSPVWVFCVQPVRRLFLRRSHSSHTAWNNDDSICGRRRSERRQPGPSRARPDHCARIDVPAKLPFLIRTSPGTNGADGAACIPETARPPRWSRMPASRESRSAPKNRRARKSCRRQSEPAQQRNGQSTRWLRSLRRDRRKPEISVASCYSANPNRADAFISKWYWFGGMFTK